MKHWLILAAAILLEVSATTSMKLSDGFTKVVPSVAMFVLYLGSLAALTVALKKIEVSVAYAVWAGVGTAVIAAIGVIVFKEALTTIKVVSILLIIAGVVGLNLGGAEPDPQHDGSG